MRLVTSKNRAIQNTWKRFQNTVFWCNFEARLTKRTALLSNNVKRSILYDTLFAEFIEKAICMKTKDELSQKQSVILRPRLLLEANS